MTDKSSPAFPCPRNQNSDYTNDVEHAGLSMRDYFAAAALTGLIAAKDAGDRIEEVPEYAYQIADAMLVARK